MFLWKLKLSLEEQAVWLSQGEDLPALLSLTPVYYQQIVISPV